jgi:hypothetical protein
MDEKEKDFVRDYNAAVKHGDPIEKLAMPKGVSVKTKVRRTTTTTTPPPAGDDNTSKNLQKKRKGVTFGLTNEDHANADE